MRTFKCEEIMCEGCVSRIKKGMEEAGIESTIDLEKKTVTIHGDVSCGDRAVTLLDDLGFSAEEV